MEANGQSTATVHTLFNTKEENRFCLVLVLNFSSPGVVTMNWEIKLSSGISQDMTKSVRKLKSIKKSCKWSSNKVGTDYSGMTTLARAKPDTFFFISANSFSAKSDRHQHPKDEKQI